MILFDIILVLVYIYFNKLNVLIREYNIIWILHLKLIKNKFMAWWNDNI